MDAKEQTDWLVQKMVQTRKSMGLRQKDVAQKMGIGQPAVSELESGNTAPRLDTLMRYAQALNCRLQVTLLANGKEYDNDNEDS